ncbi:hypothetical protein EE612_036478 [Oryza sativa]|uniref:Uncharacterized protein n=4 Tax=Oryza TaxID=4527 RepID=A0A0D3GKU5_9ORYZ|nr:uncharacterized protein LOC127776091 [Oryza glaberrima]EAZ02357.1 hypothetical protein OsI_24461 [Oryza sativa Indica Group]KAB8103877.1 hypothetical protein EE612_036478 [Oryza sativa]
MEHLLLPLLPHRPSQPLLLLLRHRRRPSIPRASSGDPSPTAADAPTDAQSATPPSSGAKPTGVKNRLRARNQARRVQEVTPPAPLGITMKSKSSSSSRPAASKSSASASASAATRREKQTRRKEWEEMSMAEKAGELYVGEKGLLFWLNKFAYASIFIMVGAWILFRFVGPSIGLYQLDAPPLAPTDVFAGSP